MNIKMSDTKLPIGIQSFEKIRENNNLYVDKTELIYDLVHTDVPYFLSRPRRFGKSLLLSTMKAYWEGKKELFSGLRIEELEAENDQAWEEYPVFYIDFNRDNYKSHNKLEEILDYHLSQWESVYGKEDSERSLAARFQYLLKTAFEKTRKRCIILIDEYDKPLLETMEDPELVEHNKGVFKGFFSTLKSFDEYIRFAFITGVTKFGKVSIFSDLNQLKDISVNSKYATICGITEDEMLELFDKEIDKLAASQDVTRDECLEELRKMYDGYHFHPVSAGVYNPFSLFNAFADGEFGSYWFETRSPDFLVRQLRTNGFDVRKFTDRTLYASESRLKDYTGNSMDPLPLLYQTGYLTIADYDKRRKRYTLAFPNDEVKYGFIESLIPDYTPAVTAGNGLDIYTLDEYIENGNTAGIRSVLTGLFASIPYTKDNDPFENYFQAVIYLIFTVLGKYTLCEMHTFSGRIDCKVETDEIIYLFEFKRDDTAENALKQIDDKEYSLPFSADRRKLFKIGVSFDSKTRTLVGWKEEEVKQ